MCISDRRDTVNAREMQPDGTYTKVHPAEGQPPVCLLYTSRCV